MLMDFVTVCFKDDLPQMRLQAASLHRYLQRFPVGQIIVILNDDSDDSKLYFQDQILPYYKGMIDKVRLVYHHELADRRILPCPYCKRKNASCTYCYQQYLKLLGSKLVSSDFYCILDAKNWITREWRMKDVQDDNGRLRISYDPGIDEQWKEHRKNSLSYYGYDDQNHPPICGLTPFFVLTEIARSIVDDQELIDHWDNTPMTEFYLIEGAVLNRFGSVDAAYWKSRTFMSSLWPFIFEQLDMETMLKEFIGSKQEMLCSGMHRRCYSILSPKNIEELIEDHSSKNLLDRNETLALIDEMRRLNP